MSSNVGKLDEILAKVERLIAERDDLKRKNSLLAEELENYKIELKKLNGDPQTAESGREMGSERLKQLKTAIKKLDHYTRELDDCIRWIENN